MLRNGVRDVILRRLPYPASHHSESGAAHKLCLSINKNAKRLMLSWLNHGSLAAANRGVAEYELSE